MNLILYMPKPNLNHNVYLLNATILMGTFGPHLVVAGLEGTPGAVEGHLHRGEGQVGHKVLAALPVGVLHLEGDTEENTTPEETAPVEKQNPLG